MKLSNTALCVATHSDTAVLAAGLVEGGVTVVSWSDPNKHSTIPIPGSVRGVAFESMHGSGDCRILAVNDQGQLFSAEESNFSTPAARPAVSTTGYSAIHVHEEHTAVVGDDNGGIHLFDTRSREASLTASVLEQADYISSIQSLDSRTIAVGSGDGSLCVYDLRKSPKARLKLLAASPSFDDDVLSVAMYGKGSYAVCGTLAGAVNVVNMKMVEADEDEPDMGRFVRRFYGHPESVSALLARDEEGVVLSGSSDGIVRVLEPSQELFLGVIPYVNHTTQTMALKGTPFSRVDEPRGVRGSDGSSMGAATGGRSPSEDSGDSGTGSHQDSDQDSCAEQKAQSDLYGQPIEGMAILNCEPHPMLAVIGHSDVIRFCDLSVLADDSDFDSDADEKEGVDRRERIDSAETGDGVHRPKALPQEPVKTVLPSSADAVVDHRHQKRRKVSDVQSEQRAFFADL